MLWTGAGGALLRHRNKSIRAISFRDFLASRDLSRQLRPSERIEQVVHAAGVVGALACDEDREQAWNANVGGALSLLSEAAEAGAKRFLLMSTSHVYEKSMFPISEGAPVRAASYYARTKLEAEDRCSEAAKQFGIEFTAVRMFSLLGPTGNQNSLAALVLRVIEGSGERIRFASDIRDFQSPQQYTHALDRLILNPSLPPLVNLGSGFGLSVGAAAQIQALASGRRIDAAQFEWVASENPMIVSDPALLRSLTGVDPQILDFRPSLEPGSPGTAG